MPRAAVWSVNHCNACKGPCKVKVWPCNGKCGLVKPLAEFPREKSYPQGIRKTCRDCTSARKTVTDASWAKDNPDKVAANRQAQLARQRKTKLDTGFDRNQLAFERKVNELAGAELIAFLQEHYWKVLRSIASGPVVLEDEDALKKKFLAPCDYCDQPYILPCKAYDFEGLRAYRLDRITAQRDASRFDRSPYSDKNTVTACSCCNVTLRHALEFVEYGEFMDFLCDVADNPNLDIEHLMKVGETNQA